MVTKVSELFLKSKYSFSLIGHHVMCGQMIRVCQINYGGVKT